MGEADFDGDGQVTLPELEYHAKRRVSDYVRSEIGGRRQMPHLKGDTRGLVSIVEVEKRAPTIVVSSQFNTSLYEKSLAWMQENNALGRDHKLVDDFASQVNTQVQLDRPFAVRLGSGIMKSEKTTILAGAQDQLFVFVPTAAKALENPFRSEIMVFERLGVRSQLGYSDPCVELLSINVDDATYENGEIVITGRIPFRKIHKASGNFALRLSCLYDSINVTAYHHLGKTIAGDKGELQFMFSADGFKKYVPRTPLPVFVELCSFVDATPREGVIVASKPVAELLYLRLIE